MRAEQIRFRVVFPILRLQVNMKEYHDKSYRLLQLGDCEMDPGIMGPRSKVLDVVSDLVAVDEAVRQPE